MMRKRFEKEHDHHGISADVHLRLRYSATVKSLGPILQLRQEIDDDLKHMAAIKSLDDSIARTGNFLHGITQERLDRLSEKIASIKTSLIFKETPTTILSWMQPTGYTALNSGRTEYMQ